MKVLEGLVEIAEQNQKRMAFAAMMEKEYDAEGLELYHAYMIEGCTESNGKLYNSYGKILSKDLVDDLYYCNQTSDGEDSYYGTCYYYSGEIGKFIAVPFEI
jgi:hypothetical protein